MMNKTLIGLLIVVLGVSLVYELFKAVYKGVKEGVQQSKDLFKGTSPEEIRKREEIKLKEQKAKEESKMNSKLYRIIHPLEYTNSLAEKKIKNQIQKGKKS